MQSAFPLNQEAVKVFEQLKSDVKEAVFYSIDDEATFTIETDASDFAVGATLSQNYRLVAFFSRSLSKSEHHYSPIEKEVYAIVEAISKWRHFLMATFMLSSYHNGKMKILCVGDWNSLPSSTTQFTDLEKKTEWRTLSRICSSIKGSMSRLFILHEDLCHPGETRMYHWSGARIYPFR
ncbi:hypothetical protein PR048_018022 [Dryococelus australis]|uniref:Reverse transcriptase/retrotransposon-derived protein RNase H-like domain-containing protein n=1 Tax=Dryococelus australis TaxID=614101 RepID=A0ABQ9HBA1_9NEOP|nr:hypothetical protein PR048_018022 [Dryococelus australis]